MKDEGGVPSRLLSVMSSFIACMSGASDWPRDVAAPFARLGTEIDLSRVALYEVHDSPERGLGVTCRVDWARPGLPSLVDNCHPPVRPTEADALQRNWAERRTRGEVIEGRTSELEGYLAAYFRAADIVSFYTVPVMVDGRWWGHFCVASDDPDRQWSEEERAAFQALAELCALAVERSRAGRALSEATRLALLAAALDAVVTIDEAGQIIDFNPAAEAMFGYSRAGIVGRLLGETIVPPHYRKAHERGMANYVAGAGGSILGRRIEIEACTAGGRVFPIELTITEIRTDHRRFFTAYIRDISDRLRAQEALEHLAYSDTVTTLPNRAGAVRQVQALGRRPTGALVLRLPDLGILSASLGEEFIRPLVNAVAERLRACLDPETLLARTSESEFAIIFEDRFAPDAVGRRLETLFHTPIEVEGRRFYLDTSIGIATGGGVIEQILRDAEMASRAGPPGRWRVFDESLRADHQHRLELEIALREALKAGEEISVAFQPIVAGDTGTLAGFEALARWNHPRLGAIPPAEFIPLAEAVGLMDPLGDLILEKAAQACARWSAGRPDGEAPIYVSINLAAPQIAAPDLVVRIADALARHGLSGAALRIEVTESMFMFQPSTASHVIQQLKAMGCTVAIDDFGTGYSSFSHLRQLPADILKIDRSFVCDLGHDMRARKIVAVMVELAHALGMSVVAEGIETQETLDAVEAIGCDFVQGFLCGRPMPLEDALALVGSRRSRKAGT